MAVTTADLLLKMCFPGLPSILLRPCLTLWWTHACTIFMTPDTHMLGSG